MKVKVLEIFPEDQMTNRTFLVINFTIHHGRQAVING